MSKWNLFEIFSHLDAAKQEMPKLHKTVRISKKNIRSSVFEQLDMESDRERTAQRCWKFGRVPAIFTAAVLLLSGTIITTAAAAGGFRELFRIAFGEETVYPETLEELYAVPDAEITDTCEEIDCRVAGVFGDIRTVTVVLEFTGENGFTLPERFRTTKGFDCIRVHSNESWGCNYYTDWNYDPSDNGHLYCIQRINFNSDVKSGATFHFDSGFFMKAEESDENTYDYNDYYYDKTYDMRDIRNWLGFSGAEINQRRTLTAEEEQRVWENFVCIDEGMDYNGEEDPEYRKFVLKEDILVEGSISIDFPLNYPKTEPLSDSFLYTDPKTGEETPMEMSLNPWCATFTWDVSAPLPSFVNNYIGSNAIEVNLSGRGHVKLRNGTVTEPLEFGEYESVWGSVTYPDEGAQEKTSDCLCTLVITFSQPVDPLQVQEVYCQKDTVLWTKN